MNKKRETGSLSLSGSACTQTHGIQWWQMWCFASLSTPSCCPDLHVSGVLWSAEIRLHDPHTSRFLDPWKLLSFPGLTSLSADVLTSSLINIGRVGSMFLPKSKSSPDCCTNGKAEHLGEASCPLKQKKGTWLPQVPRVLSTSQNWKRPLHLSNFLTDYKWQVKQSPKTRNTLQLTIFNLKFSETIK